MKNKLCCILMLIVILLNSSIMIVISEAIEAVQATTEDKIKALAEINLTKYENYDTTTENSERGSKGVLVQFNLKTGIEFAEDEEYKAIQKTETNIALPWIENSRPSRVEVITKSTQATNGGKDAKYEYHSSTGILSIIVENKDYTEKVENARDEYEIICIYGSECYADNQERNIKVKLNTYETLNNDEKVSTTCEEEYNCKDRIGGVITTEHETEDIYDGYIKANEINSDNKYETTYKEKSKIMISNKDIAEKIEIKEESEKALYTETSVDKEKALEICGENGSINIADEESGIVKVINKDSEADENGKIKVTFKNKAKNLIIQLNNVEKEGILEFENTKVIEPTTEVNDDTISTKIDIKGINSITTEVEKEDGSKENETDEIVRYENSEENNVQIKPAVSDIDFNLDNSIFANLKPNETNIRLTLRNDSAQYSLFKNPVILIEMPDEFEGIDMGTPEIMYNNDIFKIVLSDIIINENGNKVIRIQLEGEQISYSKTSLVNGINIVIPVTISLTKKMENKTQVIKCTYSNEITTSIGSKEKEVTLLNKIVNDYSVLSQTNQEEGNSGTEEGQETKKISITKDISAGNKNDVYERQVQKITLQVKNNTGEEISNIDIQDEIPNEYIYTNVIGKQGLFNGYVENENTTIYEKKIEKLQPNETLSFEYYVRVKQGQDIQGKTITSKAKATIEGLNENFESNVIENTIKESKFQIDMVATVNTDGLYVAGLSIEYKIVVKNITNEILDGTTITSKLPEGTTFDEAFYLQYDEEIDGYVRIYSEEYINNNYDESKRTVTWNIGTLKPGQEVGVLIAENLNEIQGDQDIKVITNSASVKAVNTQEYFSNKESIQEVNNGKFQVKLTTNLNDKYVYEGDEFEYIATVVNDGRLEINSATLLDELPKGLEGVEVDYCITGKTEQTVYISNEANIAVSLQPGETFTAKILVRAGKLDDGVESLEVKNSVKVSTYTNKEVTSNEVVNVILKKKTNTTEDPEDQDDSDDVGDNDDISNDSDNSTDDPSSPDVSQDGYNISGLVWLDEDKNGKRDNNEDVISGVQVKLYYENGGIVEDSDGNQVSVITGNDGKYKFLNLKKDKYVIVFLYDNNKYTTTEYQKEGVNESANSDALETTIKENGEQIKVGLTDTIEITNTDILNIDQGLIKKGVFDLKLRKMITKVIVQNNKKTKTYEYNNQKSNVVKVEIDRKAANNTNIIVEYSIDVTNEGEVAGYAQEIIDYLPEELEFKSELNTDWYLVNGNLMNTSLSETSIEPGENQTLKLVLTKKLTENDFKTITNMAEISGDYNDDLIYDIDSTPGNQKDGEDDMSSVSLIVGVKTGGAVTYTIFFISLTIITSILIYLIKRKIL